MTPLASPELSAESVEEELEAIEPVHMRKEVAFYLSKIDRTKQKIETVRPKMSGISFKETKNKQQQLAVLGNDEMGMTTQERQREIQASHFKMLGQPNETRWLGRRR